MGCVKSKRSDSAAKNANATEKLDGKSKGTTKGEKAYLVHSEMDSTENSPQINPVLLEYAQKLSEEIVARAVQQWVEVDRRYGDIPYIECDVPWDWGRRVAEETSGQARPWHWRFLRVTKQGHLSLKHLHSEWIYLLWAGVWMSCQYISFDLLLDWIILGLILKKKTPSLQKRSDPVHVSVIICIKAWASLKQSAFQLGYQLSQTLFVTLSPSRCWLSVVGLIPQSKKSYQILPGIVMFLLASESLSRPLMLPRGQESLFLLRKLLIDPLHLEKALTWNLSLVIARSETHPAVQPLLVWQEAARGCRSPLMASLEILWQRGH